MGGGKMGLIMIGLAVGLLKTTSTATFASDVPANTSSKVTLTLPTNDRIGTWEKSGDSDWYRVTLEKGQAYAAYLKQATSWDYTIALHDNMGKILIKRLFSTSDDF